MRESAAVRRSDVIAPFESAEERRAHERDTFLTSARARLICAREFERLVDGIMERVEASPADGDEKAEIRRTPGRCIVQLGPVALTVSWVRARADLVSEGRLLVASWQGTVARGAERIPERAPHRNGKVATLLHEDVLLADATGERDWMWRNEGTPSLGFASAELAARCVDSLFDARREAAPA